MIDLRAYSISVSLNLFSHLLNLFDYLKHFLFDMFHMGGKF